MKPTLQTEEPDPKTLPKIDWHTLGIEETFSKLNTTPEGGLSNQEAASRLKAYGPNQLDEAPPTTLWQMLWIQINDFVIYLLLIAAIISALLRRLGGGCSHHGDRDLERHHGHRPGKAS